MLKNYFAVAFRAIRHASIYSLLNIAGLALGIACAALQLVALSCLIAFPVAWWVMHGWLADFPYRTPIHWWVFGLAGIGAVLITLLTVSFQAIRAALSNPVESLRAE